MEIVNTQLKSFTMADWTESKIFFDDSPNKVAIKIKPSMMTADIIKTGGLVLLKNRTCLIFILDSMEEVLVENRVDNEVLYK